MKNNFVSVILLAASALVVTMPYTTSCMYTQSSLGHIERMSARSFSPSSEERQSLLQKLEQVNENSPEWQETRELAEGKGYSATTILLNSGLFIVGLTSALIVPPLACKSEFCELAAIFAGLGTTLYAAVQFAICVKKQKVAKYKVAMLEEIKKTREPVEPIV